VTVPVVEEEVPLPDTAVAALVESEGSAQDAISDRLIEILLTLWASFEAFYAGDAVAEFAQRAAQYVLEAQRAAAGITEAHLRLQIQRMDEQLARSLPSQSIADVLETGLRFGATPDEVYTRPVRQVRYLESVEKVPRETAVETARERLEKAALADLQLARTVSAQQVLQRFPQATGWRRIIHPELGNVCGLCVAAADRVYQVINRMDIHPGCVVGDTSISATGVGAATRRWYEGTVTVIHTASGQQMRLTGNHPVLTDHGWVAAQHLQQGDRVVRHGRRHRDGGRVPDEQHQPASAEELWRALTVGAGLLPRPVPLAAEDLHGDGAEGEVDVVFVDRHLAPVGDTTFIEPCRELGFGDAHGRWSSLAASGSLDLLGMGLFAAPRRVVSGAREFEPVGAGGLLVPASGSFGIRADRYFSPQESASDRGTAYAELGRNLLDRLAGEVELDEVLVVEVEAFRGHVYNFQTVEGWYDANSLVVSNCKCTVLPIVGGLDPGGQLNAADLKRLYAAAGSTGSRALAAVRVQTLEHGEMGAILTPEGAEIKDAAQTRRQSSPEALERKRDQLQRQFDELQRKGRTSVWHQERLAKIEELLAAA
jgi:hypothetical protein